MTPDETTTLGIDLGIGSCGWAVTRRSGSLGEIVAMGVRTFDVPETDKTRTPTNQLRRQFRGLRRVLRRRKQRMKQIRQLFFDSGLIPSAEQSALALSGFDPWALRAEALDRKLTGPELAVALGHIAIHRGFRSNSKRDRGANAADPASKMLKQIEATREKLGQWRTVGEMFARDKDFQVRKRNRDNDYTRSILRDDQEHEVKLIFERQRRLGNKLASPELLIDFIEQAFSQRPLQDSENLVGDCPFEPGEKRAAKRSPSFERFRYLSRLTALRIQVGREERALTEDEIARAEALFGVQKTVTFHRLRKLLDLLDSARFAGLSVEEEKRDFVARSGSAAEGTATLREVVIGAAGELAWQSLLGKPAMLDDVARVISFREDLHSIRSGLSEIGLSSEVLACIMQGVEDGRSFRAFAGAGHISAKACRAIIPYLRQGLVYSAACEKAGYNHSERPGGQIESIANPVARKALTEGLKQVRAIVQAHGLPGAIHIELARDVGKSKEERDEISRGIEKRNKEKDRLRAEFADVVGHPLSGPEDLLRYELWKEQKGRCLYTDREIAPGSIIATDNTIQVDHILPWSRSGDDSFFNKTLCYASANQEKKGRTPFEWLGANERSWAAFEARIDTTVGLHRRKRRNYLLKDASILEEKFRPRNLNDTRYACRMLADELRSLYPKDGNRRVFARPGALTDKLRRAWGIQGLKKDENGVRIRDDRHHALDALIVAATSESALQSLTRAFQESERLGLRREFSDFPPPWPGFVEEAKRKHRELFVSRAERRRARGEGHAATIRQIAESDGEQAVYERKPVEKLTLGDLRNVKDPERNAALIDSVRAWIEAGKPSDWRPLSPKGDPIAKVTVKTNKKPDVLVRGGAAERGEMTRVDVFRKRNRRGTWEYYLVPIYPHQIFDHVDWPNPPDRAVVAAKPEGDWPVMTAEYEFLWSIHPRSFIEIEKSDGTVIDGYFCGMNRSTASISIFAHFGTDTMTEGIGVKTLRRFEKYQIDRLGQRYQIVSETRTWRGAACT